MRANELRIGNMVLMNSIQSKILYGEQIDYEIESFEPIPLTEEWLVRFGFDEKPMGDYSSKFELTSNKGEKITFFQHDNKWTTDRIMMDIYIDNVHQLQNLYFALTGEELEIK